MVFNAFHSMNHAVSTLSIPTPTPTQSHLHIHGHVHFHNPFPFLPSVRHLIHPPSHPAIHPLSIKRRGNKNRKRSKKVQRKQWITTDQSLTRSQPDQTRPAQTTRREVQPPPPIRPGKGKTKKRTKERSVKLPFPNA